MALHHARANAQRTEFKDVDDRRHLLVRVWYPAELTPGSQTAPYISDAKEFAPDSTYRRALQAGATSVADPKDQFYGDRSAGVRDPAGNFWWIATHKEDVSDQELERRFRASYPQPSGV